MIARSAALVYGCIFATTCFATESGGGAYPNGVESFMTGYLPPAGNYAFNYNGLYQAKSFKNSAPVFDDFSLLVASTTARLVKVTDKKFLGGDWALATILTYADVNVKNLGGSSQHKGGMADLVVDPFVLGWHFGNFHLITGVDIYLPTGDYDKHNLANAGRNYFTLEPIVDFTYLSDSGFEVSAKTMFDYNFENKDTDYRSGNELHTDFVVGQHFGGWAFGVGGYVYKQLTADSGKGATLGSFKGKAVALGPQVSYTTKSGVSLMGRYDHEFDVRNRPEGKKLWLSAVFSF